MIEAIVDTGALAALIDRRDRYHGWAVRQADLFKPPMVTCESVLSETLYLLGGTGNATDVLLGFIERGVLEVDFSFSESYGPILRLIRKYADLPMSLADACLVRMSELFQDHAVFTLDSHFSVYRRFGRRVIPLITP